MNTRIINLVLEIGLLVEKSAHLPGGHLATWVDHLLSSPAHLSGGRLDDSPSSFPLRMD